MGKKHIYHPKTPTMRGFPKTHKPVVPPHWNGVWRSGAHLEKLVDLLEKIPKAKLRNEKLLGLDVAPLFTNPPVGEARAAVKEVIQGSEISCPFHQTISPTGDTMNHLQLEF